MPTPPRVTSRYVDVDPTLAQEWLDTTLFERQRRVRPHHVAFLAQAIRQGLFRTGTPLSFAVYEGKRILVNGQHTLRAIINTGTPLRLNIEDHMLRTKDEVADLYASFDVHLRHTGSDMSTAYDFTTTHGLTTNMVDALSGAIPIIIGGFLSHTRGKEHPVNLFISNAHNKHAAMAMWADPARAYFQTFAHQIPAFIKWQSHRAMVAAVGIVTFRYQPVAAQAFWERIARRELLTSSMPEYRLINYLAPSQQSSLRVGFAYARGVAAAWNAAFHGRTLKRGIVPRHSHLPMLIEGTPFDGKRDLLYFTDGQLSWSPIEVPRKEPLPK